MTRPVFSEGLNIAIKIPRSKYEQTVDFYKNVLNLSTKEKHIRPSPRSWKVPLFPKLHRQ